MPDVVNPIVLIPEVLQFYLETYIANPLYCVIDFFSKRMTLFEESGIVGGVGTNVWKAGVSSCIFQNLKLG